MPAAKPQEPSCRHVHTLYAHTRHTAAAACAHSMPTPAMPAAKPHEPSCRHIHTRHVHTRNAHTRHACSQATQARLTSRPGHALRAGAVRKLPTLACRAQAWAAHTQRHHRAPLRRLSARPTLRVTCVERSSRRSRAHARWVHTIGRTSRTRTAMEAVLRVAGAAGSSRRRHTFHRALGVAAPLRNQHVSRHLWMWPRCSGSNNNSSSG